jgi:hypothetical protein
VPIQRGVKTCINRKELDHYNNQLSFNKFVVKSVMNALGLSKATEKFAREENRGKRQETKRRTTISIVEPPTNAILALILHLIWRDLTENQHGRAPPCWAPPRHHRRHIRWSGPRAVNMTPSYWPMEPSPPRSSMPPLPPFSIPYTPSTTVDLGRLTRPPEDITLFTMAGSRRGTPGMSQQEASSVPAT